MFGQCYPLRLDPDCISTIFALGRTDKCFTATNNPAPVDTTALIEAQADPRARDAVSTFYLQFILIVT